MCVGERLLVYIHILFFFKREYHDSGPSPFPSPCFVAEIKDRMDHRRKQLQLVQLLDPRSNTGILYANRFLGAAINIQQQPLRHVFPLEFEANRDIRAPLSLRICHFSEFLDSSPPISCVFPFFILSGFAFLPNNFREISTKERKEGGGEWKRGLHFKVALSFPLKVLASTPERERVAHACSEPPKNILNPEFEASLPISFVAVACVPA